MIIALDESFRMAAQGRFRRHSVKYFSPGLSDPEEFSAVVAEASVIGFRRTLPMTLPRDMFDSASKLQFIHKAGSGVDWFDLEALSRLGILVGTNSGFNAVSVAEHTVALMLLCLRRTIELANFIAKDEWIHTLPGEMPMLLAGKIVGLVGIGAVASNVARILHGFGARVVCYHPSDDAAMPERCTRVDLASLLAIADIVSLHVPLKRDTVKMIGQREFELMKPTAVLINTARGRVVDEEALIEALKRNRIRAAGLDVFNIEPLPPRHPLRTMPNVVCTPHAAGTVQEMLPLQLEGTLANIDLFLAGLRPDRLVNGYILEDGRARARHLLAAAVTHP